MTTETEQQNFNPDLVPGGTGTLRNYNFSVTSRIANDGKVYHEVEREGLNPLQENNPHELWIKTYHEKLLKFRESKGEIATSVSIETSVRDEPTLSSRPLRLSL